MTPTKHQYEAESRAMEWKSFALFMKMGSGKTRVAVNLANSVPDVDLLVYIAPLRLIKPLDDTIQPIRTEVAKWGGFATAKEVIYIGVETIGQSDRQYLQLFARIRTAWNPFIIVDESIKIKNLEAKRTQRVLDLGMDADEVLRLKQITGLSELFKDREFSKSWKAE